MPNVDYLDEEHLLLLVRLGFVKHRARAVKSTLRVVTLLCGRLQKGLSVLEHCLKRVAHKLKKVALKYTKMT